MTWENTTRIDGGSYLVEILLGSTSKDRRLGLIQVGVMIVGLIFLLPGFRMFRWGIDAGLVIRSLFAAMWTAIGLLVACRTWLFPPVPLSIRFDPNTIDFDSGRAALSYIGETFENDPSQLYRLILQRRKRWTIDRAAIRRGSCQVVVNGPRVLIRTPDRTYDLGISIPESLKYSVRDAILAWINSESSEAIVQTSRSFSKQFPSHDQ